MVLDPGVDAGDLTKVIPEEKLPGEALDVNGLPREEGLGSVRAPDYWQWN